MTQRIFLLNILFLSLFSITSCNKDDDSVSPNQRVFGVFTVQEGDTTVTMNGEIDRAIANSFSQLRTAFPEAKKITMLDCPGSSDDETNLQVSKQMYDLGYAFHLTANSVIASGAVDMYVSGVHRTREAGSRIGVHSWGVDPGEPIATSYPIGHEVHLLYINYYTSVGFSQEDAEDFYYFTINAAPAESIHWMTDEEIDTYKILKD